MAVYYLDTSALVKRYVCESGTNWLRKLIDPALDHDLYTVRITGPEMVAAFYRKVREKAISPALAARLSTRFRIDWQQRYLIIEVNAAIADHAMDLAAQYGLRGYDAVHLAAALELEQQRQQLQLSSLIFVSADANQLKAASSIGLSIENPAIYG
jgi:predicted nucleic acid-binding protein